MSSAWIARVEGESESRCMPLNADVVSGSIGAVGALERSSVSMWLPPWPFVLAMVDHFLEPAALCLSLLCVSRSHLSMRSFPATFLAPFDESLSITRRPYRQCYLRASPDHCQLSRCPCLFTSSRSRGWAPSHFYCASQLVKLKTTWHHMSMPLS